MAHPYRRVRARSQALPEVGISETDNIRSLHLGTPTVQSSMNLNDPVQLVLAYSRAMMAWLLFTQHEVKHITQIGLGGGAFARWLSAMCPAIRQTAVDINPQVINIARSLFNLPEEDEFFEIIEADGAEYIKTMRSGTDVLLVDGFDGEQIIDALITETFFRDCRCALTQNGIFVTNWWSGDKRYTQFVLRLKMVFEGRVLEIPAQSHGNMAVLAFKGDVEMHFDKLKKRAEILSERYLIDFTRMVYDVRANNAHHGSVLQF